MGYTALYRKFRPTKFSEMAGQEHIIKTLKNQIVANRIGHAYLFSGGRGTGKTSTAKILARAINCLNPKDGEPCNECEICKGAISGSLTDIVEMDAASNNSVEDIRSIREEVNFLPTKAKYRVYIIDEVHMLSQGAFNALLKTLEEPPEHVKFILATTEPQKLPATILSRCQRFDFKKVSNEDIIKRLKIICDQSNIEITEGALKIIAVLSEGAVRDALSILERCIQDGKNIIDEEKIKDLVGIPKLEFVHGITKSIVEYNIDDALTYIDKVLEDGKELNNFLWEIIKYVKDILIYKASGKLDLYSDEEKTKIEELSKEIEKERLINLVYEFSKLDSDMKKTTQKTIVFQAGVIKLCNKQNAVQTSVAVPTSATVQTGATAQTNKIAQTSTITQTSAVQAQNVSSVGKNSNKQNKIENKVLPKKKYSDNADKYWPQIVNDLKENGKIVLYTNLMNSKAVELNDMTVGIEFPKGLSAFGKTVLEKQENIREISNLVSIACGKEMNIKYISKASTDVKPQMEDTLKSLANNSDIPFEIIE